MRSLLKTYFFKFAFFYIIKRFFCLNKSQHNFKFHNFRNKNDVIINDKMQNLFSFFFHKRLTVETGLKSFSRDINKGFLIKNNSLLIYALSMTQLSIWECFYAYFILFFKRLNIFVLFFVMISDAIMLATPFR